MSQMKLSSRGSQSGYFERLELGLSLPLDIVTDTCCSSIVGMGSGLLEKPSLKQIGL